VLRAGPAPAPPRDPPGADSMKLQFDRKSYPANLILKSRTAFLTKTTNEHSPRTDVTIIKIFLPKIGCFLFKILQVFANLWSKHWFSRKTQFFLQKLGKIAENCDHNIDPWK
jgi:hypothetical protein